ncbi:gamma-secretase subunit Aph-1-like [Mizuhopecten yessoensis]|uniref:Gamma-secretase subunit Aph-1 n=1 Tax=Mizuhopecten yessoensis TaxID=6573 RepID=A0A210QT58_MIZYE|nr:gamma-secretase subunit Aph-1-like [Mizuhopecten yessoensis]OWF51909.1 Gamma-secretase subunit Aph-1 [Mizuhopecten yessoensis]
MTLMEFFGCTLIAFGPPFALFLFTVVRDPLRIIVLIASGFFWLLALLVSSILWFAVVPLREQLAFGLVFSVIFQELFRLLFYKLLRKADEGLKMVTQTEQDMHLEPKDFTNKHIMAYISGLGYGIISGAFSIVNVLADMVGPGTVGIQGDSHFFFVVTAFLTLCFVFLHTFWGIIFFHAWDKSKFQYVAIVVVSHMLVSCLTLLNQRSETHTPAYWGSLVPAYVIMFLTGGLAFKIAGGSIANIKAAITCSCKQTSYEID